MKRRVGILVLIALLLGAGVRIYHVNQNADRAIISEHKKNVAVPVGENFFEKSDERMNGYTVKVVDAWIQSANEFLQENHEPESLLENIETLYMVKVIFENESNLFGTDQGINLQQYILRGPNYMLTINDIAFKVVNTWESMGFSLSLHKPFELILPFAVYEGYVDFNTVERNPPKLQICAYPEMKLISVK